MLFDTALHQPPPEVWALGSLLLCSLFFFLVAPSRSSSFPLINGRKWLEFNPFHARMRFVKDARNMIKAGLEKGSVFRVLSDNGVKTVLAPEYANEIRSHPALSFGGAISREFHAGIPGFEPFQQGSTGDEILHIALKSSILQIVAQLSSKVFLGDKICRNPDWLRITINYTVDTFIAAQYLRLWPRILRPLMANFLSSCRKIRQEVQEARAIITPVLEERRKAKEAEATNGKSAERYFDAIEWMEESAQGRPYDAAVAQLAFSLAAIHTTSDMLTQVLLDLCGQDELIAALRKEIITVNQEEGWKKTSLYKLKLMDSVIKESQRLKPISVATMRRFAEADISLSDGKIIPKGTFIFVANNQMWDPEVYADPTTFDPYRFLKLRETPGHATSAQLVSPSPAHMGFGFGKHACPGRFFAVNEVKIALCHILLKYEFRLTEGCTPTKMKMGVSLNADPFAKIDIRRREEEVEL
ncbi:hypothetical protein FE257_009593 [Aspergillus nanangensis]|uniref:Cytochrome P450 n=1 Tax=Aspergillus nanangensis TaxID=2582783 RepID=A0AAD4GSM2_ASPNN|nr:hypothetical protein FE257_009593 [Aspergillus nanangensis]